MSKQAPSRARWIFWLQAVVMMAIVTGMLLVLAGVFHEKVSQDEPIVSGPSAEGKTTAVARIIQQPLYETATGTVRPVHEASIAAKLLARVVEMNVTAGQTVAKDQVLVKLDDGELIARVRQNEATMASAEAQLDKATIDFGRAKRLKEQDAIAATEYDAASAALRTAQAAVDRASQAVQEANILLDHSIIRSPMAGTVIDKRVEVGDTVTPGQVLLTLFDPTHMQMVASVRESLAIHLQPGQTLPTRLDALQFECDATISEVVPEADAATRSFTVKVTGPCPPGAYSGMFGRLMLPLGNEDVLTVPMAAIQQVGQLTMVQVVENGRTSRRYVRVGREFEKQDVEILSGLTAGETVVIP